MKRVVLPEIGSGELILVNAALPVRCRPAALVPVGGDARLEKQAAEAL